MRLPTALVTAARAVVAALAASMPEQDAVTWVHAGAVVRHAVQVSLLPADLPLRLALARLARLHASLAAFADRPPLSEQHERAITELWQHHQVCPDGNQEWLTYPLGDLYQALSTHARNLALRQTPPWITELLIKVSYDRAQELWMHPRVIDPACGTGHILMEALHRARASHRFYDGYSAARPYLEYRPRPLEALDAVHGVDIDPHAVLIARYRLLVRMWAQIRHHSDVAAVADLPIHVAHADSLLSTTEPLLERGQYHVVVANPPYITSKDPAVTAAIRARYPDVCSGRFSLALPFHQLMMELLVPGGWCAQLTANSFTKREFGRRYIEKWLTRFDPQWVIDTSGAAIPGHGTPTVILVHRNQPPTAEHVRVLQSLRGEPRQPVDPANGLVWTAIRRAVESRESAEAIARSAEASWRVAHRPAQSDDPSTSSGPNAQPGERR